MAELGLDIKADIIQATNATATAVSSVRQDATNALLSEAASPLIVDFSEVPRRTAEVLAKTVDFERLKVSPAIWGNKQASIIRTAALDGQVRGESVADTARRLREFVLGSEELTKDELKDLRTVTGAARRKLGHSINTKATRLARTEIANASWESNRISAVESPLVGALKWNLSQSHPKWDVCDILASQNLYGLGPGEYPPEKIPPKPHPNDLCFVTDVLRPASEWSEPKGPVALTKDVSRSGRMATEEGSPGFIKTQRQIFRDLVTETDKSASIANG